MNEGYWGNYKTGNLFLIYEHEMWIRRGNNADKLGIPQAIQNKFKDFIMIEDRNRFLSYIIANAPIMRIRGHGSYVTFEFNCADWTKPIELIRKWGKTNAGSLLGLNIVNFATNQAIQTNWENFELGNSTWEYNLGVVI